MTQPLKRRCTHCGRPLVYIGKGRYACTNPDCPVKYVTVSRAGTPMRTIMQRLTATWRMDPFHNYAVKQEAEK